MIANSRLVVVLKSLDSKEWKQFGEFVLQKYGEGTSESKLWASLDVAYPKFKPATTDRTRILMDVFGPNETDDRKLRRCMNRLTELANGFLVQAYLDKKPLNAGLQLLEQYSGRGLIKHHNSLSGKLKDQLESMPRNLEWHFLDYRLDHEREQFVEDHEGRKQESGMQALSDKLDVLYLVSKLKQACAAYTRQRLFSVEYDLGLLDPVLDHLEHNPSNEPLVRLYHCCVLMMREPENPAHYQRFTELLDSGTENVTSKELKDLHVLAQNHCIRAINLGDRSYVQELFNLYRLGLDREVIQTDPTNFAPAFKNIVSVAIKLEEYDWAKEFINSYSVNLGPKYERDYLRYNLAQLNFAMANFNGCRSFIHGERFTDPFIKMNVRVLLLKTYFEMNQMDNLEAELENFKQFLHRNKQLSYHRKNCQNLIGFVRRILNLRPGDDQAKDRLVGQIGTSAHLSERKWLLQKLEKA